MSDRRWRHIRHYQIGTHLTSLRVIARLLHMLGSGAEHVSSEQLMKSMRLWQFSPQSTTFFASSAFFFAAAPFTRSRRLPPFASSALVLAICVSRFVVTTFVSAKQLHLCTGRSAPGADLDTNTHLVILPYGGGRCSTLRAYHSVISTIR